MSTDTDVVIIGAGASGLAAAKELNSLGITFKVLEGSHRIGGRAYSEEIAPDVWFDLGCAYLHQGDNNPFVDIADELAVVIGRDQGNIFSDEEIRIFKNSAELSPAEYEAYYVYQGECYEAIEASAERGEDRVAADLVDLEHEYASPVMLDQEVFGIDEVSAADVAAWEEGPDYPVLKGYGNLVAAWGADVPVELNTKIERVSWSGKTPFVDTSRGTVCAKAIICTVSTGILSANDIEFVPGLPDWKNDAIYALPLGTENKTAILFDKDVFGPEARGYYIRWSDKELTSGFEASVMGLNMAIVSSEGKFANWLEKQGTEASIDYAIRCVSEVFGNDIRKHISRTKTTAWNSEPMTRGSYSYALAGQAHQRLELARPIEDRLFFAGEATTVGDHASCHGAYRSGIRAAREVAKVL